MVKQVNIHVYSIEVRYLKIMSIGNCLSASVFWPFQGCASFADLVCYFFPVSLYYAVLPVPCSIMVACWIGLASYVWCFLVFSLHSHLVAGVVLGCITS